MAAVKFSMFNVEFVSEDDAHYLWNTVSDGLSKLGMAELDKLQSGIDAFSPDEIAQLKHHGFVVDEDYDEMGTLLGKERDALIHNDADTVSITVLPGLGCNYRCEWCFELPYRDSAEAMGPETQAAVADYARRMLRENENANRLHVNWFGGEPLLYLEQIGNLTRLLMDVCADAGVEYSASMITNGLLLIPTTADMLVNDCCVLKFQITLDPSPSPYAYAKVRKTREDALNRVVDNISYACDLARVSVRINVDAGSSRSDALMLVDVLLGERDLEGKVNLYVAPIRDGSPQHRETFRFAAQLEEEIIDYCHKAYPTQAFSALRLPPLRRTNCALVAGSSIVVGPRGDIYKCEQMAGKGLGSFAHVNDSDTERCLRNNPLILDHEEKCLSCPFFPLCHGGCAYDRAEGRLPLDCETFARMKTRAKAWTSGIRGGVKLVGLGWGDSTNESAD